MYQHLNKSLLTIAIALIGSSVFGQTSTSGSAPSNGQENDPYSKYGLGSLIDGNNAVLKGMGGITSGYANPYRANISNPASYSALERTVFEVGATASKRSVTGIVNGNKESYQTGTVTINYMHLGIPIGKKGGLSFGLQPYSHVYYALADTIKGGTNPLLPDDVLRSYTGDGGINDAFMGGSYRYKNLSLGFNVGYLFGTIRNSNRLNPETSVDPRNGGYSNNRAYYSDFSSYTRVGGLHWKGGLQYEAKLDSTHKLRFGATLATSQKLNQQFSEYQISSFPFEDTLVRDTLFQITDAKGKLTLPMSYSIGVVLTGSNRWSIGIDYSVTQWSDFQSDLNAQMNTGIAKSAYRFSIGGEYSPDPTSLKKYFSRATYRLGGYYGASHLELNNTSIPYYGITAGLSLPFRRSLSQIHFALDAGVLGTTENSLTRHNYLRFTIGLSLNDLWFIKRKYE